MPTTIREAGDALVSATIVVAGGYVLGATSAVGQIPEPGPVARTMAKAIRAAVTDVGAWPRSVRVRHRRVVPALQQELRDAPARVEWQVPLADLAVAVHGLFESFGPPSPVSALPIVVPDTVAGWRLPPRIVSELFAAAADCFRRAPWRWADDFQLFRADMPGGRSVACLLSGNHGSERGITVYEEARDIPTFIRLQEPGAYDRLVGSIVMLSFDDRETAPPTFVREVEEAGWEVAQGDAFPLIVPINTLAGGLSEEAAIDMTTVLRLLPGFVEEIRDVLAGEVAVHEWPERTEGDNGALIRYVGFARSSPEGCWPAAERLETCVVEGGGANVDAAVSNVWQTREPQETVIGAIEPTVVGLSEAFGERLAAAGTPEKAVRRHAINALHFLSFLYLVHRVPVEAVTELDLRLFLFERCFGYTPGEDESATDSMPESLEALFGYLASERALVCPWAAAVLAERGAFEQRRDGYAAAGPSAESVMELRGELAEDLWARVMMPEGIAGVWEPSGALGPRETGSIAELQRRWLLWRDEIVRSGVSDPELVRAALRPRQRAWERAPIEALGGLSPIEAVLEERSGNTDR